MRLNSTASSYSNNYVIFLLCFFKVILKVINKGLNLPINEYIMKTESGKLVFQHPNRHVFISCHRIGRNV